MKIKIRTDKKRLMNVLQECKSRTANVLMILRDQFLEGNFSNETIAKLNDHAYKAINRGGL